MTQAQSSGNVWRITVRPKSAGHDVHGHGVLQDIREYGLDGITSVASSRLFFLRGNIDAQAATRIGSELLADPVTESFLCEPGVQAGRPAATDETAIEVYLKPGVMDPVAASTITAIRDMGLDIEGVRTARRYVITGATRLDQLEFIGRRILANDCIEQVCFNGLGRHDEPGDVFRSAPVRPFELRHVEIRDLNDDALRKLSREAHLFLSLEEMKTIQAHFRKAGRDPTDLELEMLAQTWSEHCVHKTLRSAVVYRGAPMPSASAHSEPGCASPDVRVSGCPTPPGRGTDTPAAGKVEITYDNLLKDTSARATHALIAEG